MSPSEKKPLKRRPKIPLDLNEKVIAFFLVLFLFAIIIVSLTVDDISVSQIMWAVLSGLVSLFFIQKMMATKYKTRRYLYGGIILSTLTVFTGFILSLTIDKDDSSSNTGQIVSIVGFAAFFMSVIVYLMFNWNNKNL